MALFRGEWSEAVTYATDDVVFYGTSLYRATTSIAAGSGGAYTPTEAKLWLDPDSLSGADGTTIASWASSADAPLSITQASAGSRPALYNAQLNGHAAVRFDGTDFLSSASADLDQTGDWVVAAVVKTAPANAEGMVWMWGGLGPGQRRAFWASGSTGQANFSGYNENVISGSSTTAAKIVVIERASGVITIFLNGTSVATGSPALTGYSYSGFGLGGNYDGTEPWRGDLYGLVVLAPGMNRQKVEGYLAWQLGLQSQLPVGHTYASIAPAAGAAPPSDVRWEVYDLAEDPGTDPSPAESWQLPDTTDFTTVPNVLQALVSLARFALPDIPVYDGAYETESTDEAFIVIGYSEDDDESSVDGDMADEGNLVMSEQYAVRCMISVGSGDSGAAGVALCKSAAGALFSQFGATLRANPGLSGALFAGGKAHVGAVSWSYGFTSSSGTFCEIAFSVNVTAPYLGTT